MLLSPGCLRVTGAIRPSSACRHLPPHPGEEHLRHSRMSEKAIEALTLFPVREEGRGWRVV